MQSTCRAPCFIFWRGEVILSASIVALGGDKGLFGNLTNDTGADGFPKVPESFIRTPFPPVPRIDQLAVQQQFLHAGEAASQQEESWARAGAGQDLGWRMPQLRPEYKSDQLGSWARQLGPPLAHSYGGQPLPGPVYSEHFSHPPIPPWQLHQHKDRSAKRCAALLNSVSPLQVPVGRLRLRSVPGEQQGRYKQRVRAAVRVRAEVPSGPEEVGDDDD